MNEILDFLLDQAIEVAIAVVSFVAGLLTRKKKKNGKV